MTTWDIIKDGVGILTFAILFYVLTIGVFAF